MTTTTQERTSGAATIEVSALADGVVVRLAGAFGSDDADRLRGALLRPRPAACRDVLVDAGAVTQLDDTALAVLVAAPDWADQTGGQLSFTRLSEPIRTAAAELGIMRLMPLLPPPGART
jgi:anti-anti-sigma regulatory factor